MTLKRISCIAQIVRTESVLGTNYLFRENKEYSNYNHPMTFRTLKWIERYSDREQVEEINLFTDEHSHKLLKEV